jgi:hypothetical protein
MQQLGVIRPIERMDWQIFCRNRHLRSHNRVPAKDLVATNRNL